MWLAVDSGNTRVKWALIDNDRIVECKAQEKTRVHLPADRRIRAARVAHVGSAADLKRLHKQLSPLRDVRFIRSRRRLAGVTNTYRPPQALGVDRWLCLLAAYQRPSARRRGAIVISAGTAVTVDVLSAAGVFMGGLILPGLPLMPAALARATTLPAADYRHAQTADLPQDTLSAVSNSAQTAVAACALLLRRRYVPGAEFLLTGGDAQLLLPHLPAAEWRRQLLFAGMICLHQSKDGGARRA